MQKSKSFKVLIILLTLIIALYLGFWYTHIGYIKQNINEAGNYLESNSGGSVIMSHGDISYSLNPTVKEVYVPDVTFTFLKSPSMGNESDKVVIKILDPVVVSSDIMATNYMVDMGKTSEIDYMSGAASLSFNYSYKDLLIKAEQNFSLDALKRGFNISDISSFEILSNDSGFFGSDKKLFSLDKFNLLLGSKKGSGDSIKQRIRFETRNFQADPAAFEDLGVSVSGLNDFAYYSSFEKLIFDAETTVYNVSPSNTSSLKESLALLAIDKENNKVEWDIKDISFAAQGVDASLKSKGSVEVKDSEILSITGSLDTTTSESELYYNTTKQYLVNSYTNLVNGSDPSVSPFVVSLLSQTNLNEENIQQIIDLVLPRSYLLGQRNNNFTFNLKATPENPELKDVSFTWDSNNDKYSIGLNANTMMNRLATPSSGTVILTLGKPESLIDITLGYTKRLMEGLLIASSNKSKTSDQARSVLKLLTPQFEKVKSDIMNSLIYLSDNPKSDSTDTLSITIKNNGDGAYSIGTLSLQEALVYLTQTIQPYQKKLEGSHSSSKRNESTSSLSDMQTMRLACQVAFKEQNNERIAGTCLKLAALNDPEGLYYSALHHMYAYKNIKNTNDNDMEELAQKEGVDDEKVKIKEKVYQYTEASAKKDYQPAYLLLARLHGAGFGTVKNELESLKWYKKHYEETRNTRTAAQIAGLISDPENQLIYDPEEALKWYRFSASDNNPRAKYKLGKLYHQLEKIPEAIAILEDAANDNVPEAMYLLGKIYLDGTGMENGKDLIEARKWLKSASDNGIELTEDETILIK